jgi:hypothetical protein
MTTMHQLSEIAQRRTQLLQSANAATAELRDAVDAMIEEVCATMAPGNAPPHLTEWRNGLIELRAALVDENSARIADTVRRFDRYVRQEEDALAGDAKEHTA